MDAVHFSQLMNDAKQKLEKNAKFKPRPTILSSRSHAIRIEEIMQSLARL